MAWRYGRPAACAPLLVMECVVDGDAIVGVVTESRLAADCGDDSQEIAVRDCMRATVPFLYADAALSLAATIAAPVVAFRESPPLVLCCSS